MSIGRRMGQPPGGTLVRMVRALTLSLSLAAALHNFAAPANAAEPDSESRPYDEKLLRLSEVLGAIHYLRELCGANDGQFWRERMKELIDTDGGSALRKVKLTKSFNNGYRSYRRTYQRCDQTAETALGRFILEGSELSEALVRVQ